MNTFTTVLSFLVAFFTLATAAPLQLRDVWAPPVLYPHAGTVWTIGSRHNITWNTTNPPQQITNSNGFVILRNDTAFVGSDLDHPLVSNFSILAGRVEMTVPNVEPGSGYQIILFGDSGNVSPYFTISA
ncbi:hypothetical protein BD410DRAFT_794526 [Rickenella mellea]|uniref:Ser-Thr-rich glycosyl-phosphatidyl-inositol-anchored membrane family-domain-containing protein n=1 Tax=Rickenella mellea TaxID=50990 RepID=A0A4Y7PP69_9AGAM|nr:hypothetical protein BD410DRAFT_794526 [Rickenella mellea]